MKFRNAYMPFTLTRTKNERFNPQFLAGKRAFCMDLYIPTRKAHERYLAAKL